MKARHCIKRLIDICMVAALPLLMAYSLIGEEVHEWIGAGMLALVIVHNILNIDWYKNLFKGRYTPFRVFQSILDLSIALSMTTQMVSGIIMSRYVFSFLSADSGLASARTIHMLCAYWGFTLLSLHVGIHANMIMAAMHKAFRIKKSSNTRTFLLRGISIALMVYGIYAFIRRQVGSYMLLKTQFAFFDFNEPLAFFLIDYLTIMGMFICAGHYIGNMFRKISVNKLTAAHDRGGKRI